MRRALATALLVLALPAQAFIPRTGQWWNENESGSGYNIEVQDGTLTLTIFSYDAAGPAQWYFTSGPTANGGKSFSGRLEKFRGGQCISCSTYPGFPPSAGDDGPVTITFQTEISATLSLPNGRTVSIKPFNFGFGEPPTGLLGTWAYVFTIIGAFVDQYTFTTQGAATSTGNGTVLDIGNSTVCERKVSGIYAGKVYCVHFSDDLTEVLDEYTYVFALDGTAEGTWTAPFASKLYDMDGYLRKTKSGYTKDLELTPATRPARDHRRQEVEARESQQKASAPGLAVAARAAEIDEYRSVLLLPR